LGVTVAILQRLRDGRTNEAIALLEGRVSTDIISFVASYRELPDSIRQNISLKSLEYARITAPSFHSSTAIRVLTKVWLTL
jgi:hypothetical protein